MSMSPTLFSSDDEDEGHHKEEVLLKKFQAMLHGVPPPSSITMSKLSASDMLIKYKENNNSFGFQDVISQKQRKKTNATPLVFYVNSSKTSEEIAVLSQKVLSRYVHSETMSSCNIWFESSTTTNSVKKYLSRRSRLGFSPGSRLSHLARRRQIFSSENLQKLANSERRRHIEIEKPNISKNKSLSANNEVDVEKNNSFRRALFLSPEDEETNTKHYGFSLQQNYYSHSYVNNKEDCTAIGFSQRDMNASTSRKRKRLESRERSGNWPRRALTFTDKDTGKNQDINSSSSKVISEIQLSLHHKAKILWAVSATLKEKCIHISNPQFKSCASALFMICRKNLSKIINLNIDGGTSDKILYFAREHIDDVLKKFDVFTNSKPQEQCTQEMLENSAVNDLENTEETTNVNDSRMVLVSKNSIGSYSGEISTGSTSSVKDIDASVNGKENLNVRESSCDTTS